MVSLAPVLYVQENQRVVGVGEYAGPAEGVHTVELLGNLQRSSDSSGNLVRFLQFGIQQCIGSPFSVRPRVIVELAIDCSDESLFAEAVSSLAGDVEVRRLTSDV